jgi:hypothetical protein
MITVLAGGTYVGVLPGGSLGTAQFSSSASSLAINSEVTSSMNNMSTEPGVTDISNASGITPDGAWYEMFITSMHASNFWEEFQTYIINDLTPGRLYGILLQPRNKIRTVTVGTSFNLDSTSLLDRLEEAFMPILQQMEEEYNEDFNLDTRVKIRDLGPIEPTKAPAPAPRKTRVPATQTNVILQAMQDNNKTMLQAMQAQTDAMLQAFKTQQTQPTLNWTPLIQAVASAVPAMVGVPVSIAQPVPTTAPPAPVAPTATITPQPAATASTDPGLLAQLDSLAKGQASLAQRLNTLAQGHPVQGQGSDATSARLDKLAQGYTYLLTGSLNRAKQTAPYYPDWTPWRETWPN